MPKNPAAVALGRKGGKSTSEAKKAAGRENVKKALAARLANLTMEQTFTTAEVAKAIGVDPPTLLRWLQAREIPEPTWMSIAGSRIRVWTQSELDFAKAYKEANYRKRL